MLCPDDIHYVTSEYARHDHPGQMAFPNIKPIRTAVSVAAVLFLLGLALGGEQSVPCYFIFGDSLADCGNNNDLNTTSKANYPPYGVDFPQGPTGRFTNGRTAFDLIAELLGFEVYMKPFTTAKGVEILLGVNYASGGAGILDETGMQSGEVIPLNQQLRNHNVTVKRIAEMLRDEELASAYLGKCMYSVGMGNNDYINNYFMPDYYNSSKLYTPLQFAELLILEYSRQLKTLYQLGARKVAVFAVGLVGCVPEELYRFDDETTVCVSLMDTAAALFNDRLTPLVEELNANYTDATFTYINTEAGVVTMPATTIISSEAFIANMTCCKVRLDEGLCYPDSAPCTNRTEYTFFDGFHPTEEANIETANVAYYTNSSEIAYPYNISYLAVLDSDAAKNHVISPIVEDGEKYAAA
ncbi:hypothetical protein MLD38_022973 [Melastoma candidum]|uniref:Uncharacterized protein n=1 Tax=Melastoma candidum TaxID=119954 RepID=A0ACB9QL18_9MYRT|nr:hypothetical protein MLD38_022973 [Melastoma candidum]